MGNDNQEFLDVVEAMYAPEDIIIDMELEDIHEAEQSLLMGDDLSDIIEILDDDDIDDLDDDIDDEDDEQEYDPDEGDDDDDELDEPIEAITEADLFDEFGCVNY